MFHFLLALCWKLNINNCFSETDITNELKHWRLDGSDDELRFISSFVLSA